MVYLQILGSTAGYAHWFFEQVFPANTGPRPSAQCFYGIQQPTEHQQFHARRALRKRLFGSLAASGHIFI
jgi:hypothetical protein